MIAALGEPVFVANHNAPDQVVVAGGASVARMGRRGRPSAYLCQPHAGGAACSTRRSWQARPTALAPDAGGLFLRPSRTRVQQVTNRYLAKPEESCQSGGTIGHTGPLCGPCAANHVRARRTVLVEVGPQQALTRLNRKIVDWADAASIACDDPKRPGVEQLCCVQALLERSRCPWAMEQPAAECPSAVAQRRLSSAEIPHFDATARVARRCGEAGRSPRRRASRRRGGAACRSTCRGFALAAAVSP